MKKLLLLLPVAALFALSGVAFAGQGEVSEKEIRRAVLVVSFGTSMPEARHAIDSLVDEARRAFPEAEVRLAYTSNIIRRKILKEENLFIPTPLEALAKLQDDGFMSRDTKNVI